MITSLYSVCYTCSKPFESASRCGANNRLNFCLHSTSGTIINRMSRRSRYYSAWFSYSRCEGKLINVSRTSLWDLKQMDVRWQTESHAWKGAYYVNV